MLVALLAGLALGFVGSIPIAGPISALVLERALAGEQSFARGIGVGAALAEGTYATLAFVGMGEIMDHFPRVLLCAKVFGVIVLGVVATLLLRGRDRLPPEGPAEPLPASPRAFVRGLGTGYAIAILNPTLIATWSTTTATLFATGYVQLDPRSTIGFAIGTIVGIGSWLVILVALLERQHGKLAPESLRLARRGAAALVIAVALMLAAQIARA